MKTPSMLWDDYNWYSCIYIMGIRAVVAINATKTKWHILSLYTGENTEIPHTPCLQETRDEAKVYVEFILREVLQQALKKLGFALTSST